MGGSCVRSCVIVPWCGHGLQDPFHKTPRPYPRTYPRLWRGVIQDCDVVRPSSQSWLSGLALSHVLHLIFVRRTKSTFVRYLPRRLASLAPTNEESAWAQWEKNFYRIKKSLNEVLVMWHVWLVWILTTKHKSMKRVENLERYVVFSCHYSLILLIIRFMFCSVNLLF